MKETPRKLLHRFLNDTWNCVNILFTIVTFLEHFETPVRVKCMWDDPRLHIEGPPLYVLWQKRDSLPANNALTDPNPFNKT